MSTSSVDKIVNLNNLMGLPKDYIYRLERFTEVFKETDFLDDILANRELCLLVEEINEFCLNREVIGFHYTRAIPEQILLSGLTCRTGNDIRSRFIDEHGILFSKSEHEIIQTEWNRQFDKTQQQSRDNYIFFNFTTTALYDGGAESLLQNFGGEQIYMPFFEIDKISHKLQRLGTPMILKCRLDPKQINTFYENPWGKIVISTYHSLCNSEACRVDQDGYQSVDVDPDRIEILYFDQTKDYREI